jgi:hypothetical protein
MASGSEGRLVEVLFRWDIHEMVNYALHHDHLGGLTSALECLPLELLEHKCDAAPALVVSGIKSGRSSLYCLDLVDGLFLGRIQHTGHIFDGWSNQGGVKLCLDLGWAAANVLTQER